MSEPTLDFLDVNNIRIIKGSLREVDQNGSEYLELLSSVREKGILNPILVRPQVDPETNQQYYALTDGLQRLTAARAVGLSRVPAMIKDTADDQVLIEQIITNCQKVTTKPVEFARGIQAVMQLDPLISVASLAAKFHKSDAWVKQILNLTKLTPEIAKLVDAGEINVAAAYDLSTLPPENQEEFLERALTMTHTDLTPLIVARKKELDKARREGRAAEAAVFSPEPYLQKVAEIKAEMETGKVGEKVIGAERCSTASEGWAAAIKWVLHMDSLSVAEAKAKFDEQAANKAKKAQDAALEREKKKAAALEVKSARTKVAMEAIEKGQNPEEALKKFDAEQEALKSKEKKDK